MRLRIECRATVRSLSDRKPIGREIYALNKKMIAAGVRKLACGLGSAKSLRAQSDGGVLITDGPYLETKEHIGGFWMSECADMDEAVA